jgi:hypothetical protein
MRILGRFRRVDEGGIGEKALRIEGLATTSRLRSARSWIRTRISGARQEHEHVSQWGESGVSLRAACWLYKQ